MPGDELPKTPPKTPEKLKPDDIGHITHKAKKLEVKEPVSVVCERLCCVYDSYYWLAYT